MIVYTGVDGAYSVSVSYNPLSRRWKVVGRRGRTVCSIPSRLCLVKVEKKPVEKRADFLKGLKELYGTDKVDAVFYGDRVFVGVYRDYQHACQEVDLEPFALARVLSLFTDEGFIVNAQTDRTTFVYIEGGLISSYRVVLRSAGEDPQEVLRLSGMELSERPVLLAGTHHRALMPHVHNRIENPYCAPELTCALGCALKHVVKKPYPSFKKREVSPEELRRLSAVGLTSMGFLLFALLSVKSLYNTDRLRESARGEFKKVFPNLPSVSVYEQVRGRVSTGERFELTKRLSALSSWEGLTLYSFEWDGRELRIRGEGPPEKVKGLKPSSMKTTDRNTLEFEVIIR